MTCRRISAPDVRSVTVSANEITILVDCHQFVGNFQMRRRFVVTLTAGGDGHVGFQTTQGCRLCNIDMTGCAFLSVWLATMAKLQRDSLRRIHPNKGLCCQFVTAAAVFAYRLLRLPMTVET